jgi:opacity protein-like surface antigen
MPVSKFLVGAVAVVALATTPAVAQTPPPEPTPPCAVSQEYPTVGLTGKHEDVDSPLLPDTAQALGEPFASETYVDYPYRLDVSGSDTHPFATKANINVSVNWDNDGDFDLYVLDKEGSELGSSTDFVADRVESVTVAGAAHCLDFVVRIQNFLGPPALVMTLDTTVSGLKP